MNLNSATGADDPAPARTRQQILEVAGEVFAEAGFHHATVREICRRAGANIAAVNYHFGDKETLYTEVLRYAQQKAFEKHPPFRGAAPTATPEEKLRAFVHSFLLRIFDEGPIAWFGKMMSREMVEPTRALDLLLRERLRPMVGQLRGIVSEILSCPAGDEKVRLCIFSIVSQCVFYHHCRTMILRLFPEQKLNAAEAERLADHITRFSLAAMKHLPEPRTTKSQSRLSAKGRH
jgi:AcrR family transcriptional regulator